ncbi:prosaposin [Ceratina calcarata]|uniref:Prosaposin n=1 Tax=Ceratina calcarata TaxID=156304 RepID=A0AAJ7ND27_9HYME|nr:prosaposin [Ceratina calcarata]
MRSLLLIALCAIISLCRARVIITAGEATNVHLLGEEECTWGPSYWCENIKTAAGCNATKHCIKKVWSSMTVPEDTDSVCDVCKDMVQQARDQLESNETQTDLKNVFEGSCKLIHVKPIVKECIKIVDQYIPDLVETLASQMNPSVVCSVAGLCNSKKIDRLLEEYESKGGKIEDLKTRSLQKDELEPNECSKCYVIATHMEHKFASTPKEKVLQQMLNVCGELGTFSDACTAHVLTYFNTIYEHLKTDFHAKEICHLSGQCSSEYHKHEDDSGEQTLKVDIRPLSTVGIVDLDDDLPCKLCEQLVGHLRDLLVANTTESEFEQVLKGICKQTKSFSAECTGIVDEYYREMYEYLTKSLDVNFVCQMSGICPGQGNKLQSAPTAPLLPANLAQSAEKVFKNDNHEKQLSNSEVEAMQLPIERLVPFPLSEGGLNVEGTEVCALCEYVLHYVQNQITDPTNEEKVKEALDGVCQKLPQSIVGQCTEFIDTYGDAVVAILAQEIDPSQACPMLHLCPSDRLMELWKKVPQKYLVEEKQHKPSCPLCLLAVTQIYDVIKNNKTEANIETQLDKLCLHLPNSLVEECKDLVKGYSKELIELLLADATPQEVCVFIKLCDGQDHEEFGEFLTKNGEIITNEIPNFPLTKLTTEHDEPKYCMICEYAMHFIDMELGSEWNKKEIEHAVHGVCRHFPDSITKKCDKFIVKFADVVIDIITKGTSPKEVCKAMGLCSEEIEASSELADTLLPGHSSAETYGDAPCEICAYVMRYVDKELGNNRQREKIEHVIREVCHLIPEPGSRKKCNDFVTKYADIIIDMLTKEVSPKQVCAMLGLCNSYVDEMKDSVTECAVCKSIMSVMTDLLDDADVPESLKHALTEVCHRVPDDQQNMCISLINSYGQSIMHIVKSKKDLKEVCLKIGVCPEDYSMIDFLENSRIKRSYEKNRIKHCTWGPVYWCSTNETARECKAEEHCKEHVWKADYAPLKQLTLSEPEPNV